MSKLKTMFKISFFSIALILLLVSSIALAAAENDVGNTTIKEDYASSTALATTEESASSKVIETKISNSELAHSSAIYGNRIVWMDYRGEECNIYMYDLSTKKESQISTSGMVHGSPAIYDNKIVWGDSTNYSSIHIYDVSTQKDTEIPGNTEKPAIYGDKVVYDDYYNIYIYNLSTSQKTQVTPSGPVYYPAIYDNIIVWQGDSGAGKWNIYMYDLSTKKETQITTSGSAEGSTIYGNRIVYVDTRNGNTDIYMYNVSTKKETQITSSPDVQAFPAIYGDRIVWEDDGGEDDGGTNHGIYMYDISTNQKMKISAKGSAYSPAIYGNNIVWEYNSQNWKSDIYMATVGVPQPKPPVAAFYAKPTSGKVPLKVQFTDKSSNSPTSWKWNFGDGKYSTLKNPSHTYSKAGKYTVSLTVKNTAGTNVKTIKNYVTASELKSPVAAFSASPRSGKAPLKVQFTDKSANSPTSWKWSFGDGTYSTAKNPVHTYSKAGKYTVSLTVKNAKGSNTKTISGYIVIAKK
jgi:beta propeller repeat protein